MYVLSHVQVFATPWTIARQAPLPMEFSRQEYRSGVPRPPPEDLPNPEIEPMSLASPALVGFPCGSDSKESACNAGDRVRFLSWEAPLEEGVATHSSILTWRIPWTEEPGRL